MYYATWSGAAPGVVKTPQHQVFDIDPLRLAGRNLAPGHTIRDLLGLLQLLVIENAKRAQRTVLPLGHSFDRIVDRGIDDLVDQRAQLRHRPCRERRDRQARRALTKGQMARRSLRSQDRSHGAR